MSDLTQKKPAGTFAALALVGALALGSFAPAVADTAYAQGGMEARHVTVQKYIDGSPATTTSAQNLSFLIDAAWDNPHFYPDGAASFELSSDGSYMIEANGLRDGAAYTLSERLDGNVVGASCEEGKPFALAGYSAGASMEAAAAATTSSELSLDDIEGDQFIIVWNETCEDEEPPVEPSGNIGGEVTGGLSETDPGELAVTAIDGQKTTAEANGTFEDGFQYVFHITVPENEPNLAMKFTDWAHNSTSTDHAIPVASNMRISSAQADNDGETILLTAADTYSSPDLHITGDLDPETEGLQVQVLVEMAVPADTYNGIYSTGYGIRTLE